MKCWLTAPIAADVDEAQELIVAYHREVALDAPLPRRSVDTKPIAVSERRG